MTAKKTLVKAHLLSLFDELFAHDGFATLTVEIRLLKRGQKEVILGCGKQHRYVIDYDPVAELPRETSRRGEEFAG